MSLETFGEYLGLYDNVDIQKDGFFEHFDESIRDFDYSQLKEMWKEMTRVDLREGRAPSWGKIRDPRLRVILAMINLGLIGRKTGLEKAHKDELFILGCINRKKVVNVAHFVAMMMKNVLKGAKPGAVLRGGHWVTRLGKTFGLEKNGFNKCTRLTVDMKLFGLTWLKYSKLVTVFNDEMLHEISVRWVPITKEVRRPQSSSQPSSSQQPSRKRSKSTASEAPSENNDQDNVAPTQGSLDLLVNQMSSMLTRMENLDKSIQGFRNEIKVDLGMKLKMIEGKVDTLSNRFNDRVAYEDTLLHSLFQHAKLSYTDENGVRHNFPDPTSSHQQPEDTSMPDI